MSELTKQRTNAEWLASLDSEAAADELRSYVLRGLRKVFAGRNNVDDADIEDFTQDALVQIINKKHTFRGDSRFTTWAMAIAIRLAYGTLRKRRYRRRLAELNQDTDLTAPISRHQTATPDQVLLRGDLVEKLHQAVQHDLTLRQRQAVLEEVAGVPTEIVAENLNISRNSLYKLHHDARKKLRKSLNAAGFSDEDVRQELAGASKQ